MVAMPDYTLASFGAIFVVLAIVGCFLKASLTAALQPSFSGREKKSRTALTRAGSPRNLRKSPPAWRAYGPSTKSYPDLYIMCNQIYYIISALGTSIFQI